jgi:acetyl esterase
VVFHFHGGWILGDKDTNERLHRELANTGQAVVVFVDYTPPPTQYPVQNEQAYTALQWAIANAAGIGADPARVAMANDSDGGNLTAALTLMAKERGRRAGSRSRPRCSRWRVAWLMVPSS